MTKTAAPHVGHKYHARTTTPGQQQVTVEVTAIDAETAAGWTVWGYRVYRNRRAGVRQTSYPQLYFISRAA